MVVVGSEDHYSVMKHHQSSRHQPSAMNRSGSRSWLTLNGRSPGRDLQEPKVAKVGTKVGTVGVSWQHGKFLEPCNTRQQIV